MQSLSVPRTAQPQGCGLTYPSNQAQVLRLVCPSNAVGEVGVGCLFAAVMTLVNLSLPVLDACRAMSG